MPSGYWAASVGRQNDIPFAVWALGSDIWGLGKIPVMRGQLQRVLQAADRCFADGMKLAEDVEWLSGRRCQFLASARQLPHPGNANRAESAPYNRNPSLAP